MADNDGEVRIATTLDTQDLQKQLDKLKAEVERAGRETEKKAAGFGKLQDIFKKVGVGAISAGAAIATIKKTAQFIGECTDAYNVQADAEKKLELAARNNPYLNNDNVRALQNFASELQSVSEIGDEASISIMANLAATGRTQEEITKIMSAAADMAAATGQDVASVAETLNATLNGNAGALGRTNSAIKSLTAEELKNGKAVEIVANQYKGMAKETANAGVQLKNAIGDYKEELGAYFAKATEPVKSFFAELIGGWASAKKARREYEEADKAVENGTATASQYEMKLQRELELLDQLNEKRSEAALLLSHDDNFIKSSAQYTEFTTWSDSANPLLDFKAQQREIIANYEKQNAKVEELTRELNKQKDEETQAATAAKEKADAEERAAAALERQRKRDAEAQAIKDSNKASRDAELQALELRKKLLNENYDAQDQFNIYLNSYIDLITRSGGLISENNDTAKELMKIIEEMAPKAQAAAAAEERLNAALELREKLLEVLQENEGAGHSEILTNYKKEIKDIEQLRAEIGKTYTQQIKDENGNLIINEEEKNAALLALDRRYAQAKKDVWASMTAEINGYTQEALNNAQAAAELMLESVTLERDKELAELEIKYSNGELAETEYYEKQKQIQQKAAREEYKIKMFEWSASIAAATANIAEGVTKAIAQGFPMGLINGALLGAAGAVQMASIIASKPTPPNFWQGGVIGGMKGASMGADNTYIHARSGEMVINAMQQRNLWDMINGQDARAAAGYNLTVNNTQAGRIDTNIREENGGLIIDILDKRVNKGLSDGSYDAGYAAMQSRQQGVRIL